MEFFYSFISKIAHFYLAYSIVNSVYNNPNVLNNENLMKYAGNFLLEMMRYYSTGEIYFNRFKKQIKTFIESNPELNNYIKKFYNNKIIDNIELIQDGNIISMMTISDFIDNKNKNNNIDNSIFYIYSDNNNENGYINKIIIHDSDKFHDKISISNKTNKNIEYDESGYKFIMFEIIIHDTPISINLTTEKYNYLIIDNVFDLNFIKYLLKKYHPNIYAKLNPEHICNYKIKVIDHNINVLEFSNKPLRICREKGLKYLNDNEEQVQNIKKEINEELNILRDDYDCIDVENYKYN